MTTISHEPSNGVGERPQLLVPEVWASIAISVMWLAVLVDAIFGPDIVSTTPGGTSTTLPSAVVVSVFAFLGTWVVARYGFARRRD
jgi:hypothetical protein